MHGIIVLPDRSAAIHAYGFYDDEIVPGEDPRIARRRFTQVTTERHPAMR